VYSTGTVFEAAGYVIWDCDPRIFVAISIMLWEEDSRPFALKKHEV
jgi:hypothetical protein